MRCAAHEGPLDESDRESLGPRLRGYAERLVTLGELRERNGTFVPRRPQDYPAADVSLRSSSRDSFAVVDTSSGEVIGTIEAARALATAHDGAVYLHMGRSYEVQSPRPRDAPGARASRSTATGSRSPRRRPRPRSSGCSTAAKRWA